MDPIVWKGPDALRPLLIPVDRLHEDPANANVHTEGGVRRLAAGLARFGQQHTLVCDGDFVMRAGNGRLRAARLLGWTHLAVVPSDLWGFDLTAYALADNQLGTLSHLDPQKVLEVIEAARSNMDDYDPEALGYSAAEVDKMFDDAAKAAAGAEQAQDAAMAQPEKWMVVVTCRDEEHQVELLERFQGEGLEVQAIVS
jgi:ParB-like chromosome segregation protein Spo0J